MKHLFLLRHAKSDRDETGIADIDRPLTPRGTTAARAVGAALAARGARPDLVLCSVARRTQETCALVVPLLGDAPVMVEEFLYDADPGEVLDRLRRLPDSVSSLLLVGHNPILHWLALDLVDIGISGHAAGLDAMREKFPTGAVAAFSRADLAWHDLDVSSLGLDFFLRPKDVS